MRIVIPELKNDLVQKAIVAFPKIDFIEADSPENAAKLVRDGLAESMISGLEYPSRDVLLTYKKILSLNSEYFSSCFMCRKDKSFFALADGGVNKTPNRNQLLVIVEDTAKTFQKFTGKTPKIAMLSYSTNGSGGKNLDLEKIHFVIDKIRREHPEYIIDGEMQLDVAIDPEVAKKKYPNSAIMGDANVLIVPDLNSGNILYKSLERFGGFTVAGPIIQGFSVPLADLSRGSTVDDIILTISILINQIELESRQ